MTKTIELKRLSIDFNNDWEQVVGSWNWITFNFIKLYMEKDTQFGMFEIEIYLLGFGMRLYWTYDKKTLAKKVKEYEGILKNGKFVSIDEALEILESD